ncbi:MAG: hypothetical protein IT370_13500 [Deltaproteobacteria bacterium]|nr:hypothetical protein [Deltaproteobacteria bacterium]
MIKDQAAYQLLREAPARRALAALTVRQSIEDLLDAIGIVRRQGARLDRRYLQRTIVEVCELAEDLAPQRRLEGVLARAAGP